MGKDRDDNRSIDRGGVKRLAGSYSCCTPKLVQYPHDFDEVLYLKKINK